MFAKATAALGGLTAHVAGVEIGYGPDRPWYEQWRNVRLHLELAEASCKPAAYRGNEAVKASVSNFFLQCFHLGDWLWQDQTTQVTEPQVRAFIASHPALRVCAGLANTIKHHTRTSRNAMTARVASIRVHDQTGTQVTIGWTEAGSSGSEDALDLARRCVSAWERFLRANGLQSPI